MQSTKWTNTVWVIVAIWFIRIHHLLSLWREWSSRDAHRNCFSSLRAQYKCERERWKLGPNINGNTWLLQCGEQRAGPWRGLELKGEEDTGAVFALSVTACAGFPPCVSVPGWQPPPPAWTKPLCSNSSSRCCPGDIPTVLSPVDARLQKKVRNCCSQSTPCFWEGLDNHRMGWKGP